MFSHRHHRRSRAKIYEDVEGHIGRTHAESTPWWPTPAHHGDQAPNVIVMILDDTGCAHFGSYGHLGSALASARAAGADDLVDRDAFPVVGRDCALGRCGMFDLEAADRGRDCFRGGEDERVLGPPWPAVRLLASWPITRSVPFGATASLARRMTSERRGSGRWRYARRRFKPRVAAELSLPSRAAEPPRDPRTRGGLVQAQVAELPGIALSTMAASISSASDGGALSKVTGFGS